MPSEDPGPQTLPALLDRAVELHGDFPAVARSDGTITYRELQASSARLAKGLVALGVGKGTRVSVLAGNTPFLIESLFATAQLGALLAPISTLAAPGELAYVLRHSDAQVLLAARRYVGRDYGETIARALPALATVGDRRRLRLSAAPFLRSICLDDAAGLDWARPMAEVIAEGAADPALDAAFLKELKAEVAPSDEGVVIYTSGSTASPKAVIHTQGTMARHSQVLAGHHFVKPRERVLCALPIFWVGGLSMLLEVFCNGGCLVLPDGVSARSMVDAIRALKPDLMHGWPAQRKPMREMMEAEGLELSGVRGLRDEYLPDGSLKQPDQSPNSLGMTESFGPHCASPAGSVLPEHRRGAFGPVIGGYDRRVVDPATGEVAPYGQVGELQLRGAALMSGYYKRERSEVFTPDGYFPTHDLVRFEPDGYMYFEGRTGDMLKTKGANVSRVEVEVALRNLDGVSVAVVCGLPDPVLGQRIVAAVVPSPGADPKEPDLKAELAERLAGYKIPTHILFIDRDDLMWTASGKVRIPEMGKLIAERLGLNA